MNINDLTIGQAKELAAQFVNNIATPQAAHPMVGKYAVVRCYSAGVHAGVVASVEGDTAILINSRRLWRWFAAEGIALSGVAQHGIVASKSRLDSVNPEIYLTGVIEVIPATVAAQESINNG